MKSSFVHKMQNPRDHAPIVEVLEAAGVEIREKVVARASDVRSSTPTVRTPKATSTHGTTTGSAPEPTPGPSSAAPSTTSTLRVSNSIDDKVVDLSFAVPGQPQSEPPTPIIENPTKWMADRIETLAKMKQRKAERRKGWQDKVGIMAIQDNTLG